MSCIRCTKLDREKEKLELENLLLRSAHCGNCKWDKGDGMSCNNPIDQCGKNDRMMWQAKQESVKPVGK